MLVVDDEQNIRNLFQQLISLGLPGCRVDMAVNGAEAVEQFREVRHGLILMDLHMPVMDGEQAFLAIRALCDEENLEMPSVVFCTGFDPSHKVQNAIAGNPKHCLLRKPVTNDTLLEALKVRLKA